MNAELIDKLRIYLSERDMGVWGTHTDFELWARRDDFAKCDPATITIYQPDFYRHDPAKWAILKTEIRTLLSIHDEALDEIFNCPSVRQIRIPTKRLQAMKSGPLNRSESSYQATPSSPKPRVPAYSKPRASAITRFTSVFLSLSI